MNLKDKQIQTILEKRSGFSSAELRQTDGDGRTALIRAVLLGDIELVRAMLEAGADVEETDYQGDTALAHANRAGFGEVGRLLVEQGADPEHRNLAGRVAGVPTVSAPPEQMADSAHGSAATAGDRDEVTQESSRESISDLRKSVLAEVATQMRPTIAQPTQDLIDAIEDEKYDWSAIQLASIDIPRIVHYILEADSNVEVTLDGDALKTWMHVLTAIAEIDRRWMKATLTKLDPNIFDLTSWDETWEPRVLWNGSVLIRNGHRVLGLSYSETVFFDESTRNVILHDIDKLGTNATIITEHDDVLGYTVDTSQINLNGNNIIVLADTNESLDSSELLTSEFVSDTASGSLGGSIALQLYRHGMHLYSIDCEDNYLDYYVLDSPVLAPVCREREEIPLTELAIEPAPPGFAPELGWWSITDRELQARGVVREKSRQIVTSEITPVFHTRIEPEVDEAIWTHMETLGVLDGVASRLSESMGDDIRKRLIWAPKIFADAPDKILGYLGAYPASTVPQGLGKRIVIDFILDGYYDENELSPEELSRIGNIEPIQDILTTVEPSIIDPIFELNIPESWENLGPWVEVSPTQVERFTKQVAHITGDDYYLVTEILRGHVLRCHFALPDMAPRNLRKFGKEFGTGLANLVDAGEVIISNGFNIVVPAMGVLQGFDGADPDSGNL